MDKFKMDETEKLRKRVAELEAQLKKKEEAKGRAFQRKLLKKTGLSLIPLKPISICIYIHTHIYILKLP